MQPSNDPWREVGTVLRKHIDSGTLRNIVEELQDVPGNKTFREAVERLSYELLKDSDQR